MVNYDFVRVSTYVIALCTMLSCTSAFAVAQIFEYKTFYDEPMRIAPADQPPLDARLAYFLVNPESGKICDIRQIVMSSGRHHEVLPVGVNQEINIPLDANLRRLNPNITMEVIAEQPCSMSVQVVSAVSLGTQVEGKQLTKIIQDMNELYQRLGTFLTRRFMPNVSGVVLHFSVSEGTILSAASKTPLSIKKHILILDTEQIASFDKDPLRLPVAPQKITPLIQSDPTKK